MKLCEKGKTDKTDNTRRQHDVWVGHGVKNEEEKEEKEKEKEKEREREE